MTPITPEKIEELRELTKLATPGEWQQDQDMIFLPSHRLLMDCSSVYDAAYIAAFNPKTVSALLDLAQRAMVPQPKEGNDCYAAVEAIQFALKADEGMQWLRCWNEGDFESCRREWPESPEAAFIGADPLHPKTRSASQLALPADKLSDEDAAAIRDLLGTLEKHEGTIERCAKHAKAILALLALPAGPVRPVAFDVELPQREEENIAQWVGAEKWSPWVRSLMRLALLLNTTKRGLIDYQAAIHFANELVARTSSPPASGGAAGGG